MKTRKVLRREFLQLSAIAGLGLVASACGASNTPAAATGVPTEVPISNTPQAAATIVPTEIPSASQEKMTLTYWHPPHNPKIKQIVEDLCKPFMDAHPNITVECDVIPWGDVETKWQVAIQSGETPDVGYIYDVAQPTYVRMGGLEPLDQYLDANFLSKYVGDVVNDGRGEDGKLYSLVPILTTDILFYNVDMFNKAGIPIPDSLYSPTWEEYHGWLLKLKEAGFYGWDWGIRTDVVDHVHWDGWRRFGASDTNADHTQVTFDTSEAIAWAQAMQDLAQKDKVLPPKALTVDWVRSEAFLNGEAATLENWTGLPAQLKTYPNIKWGVCKAWHGPGDGGKSTAAYLGIGFHSVFKDSKHKPEAIELLKFMNSPEFLLPFNQQLGFFPPITGGDKIYANADPDTKKCADTTWNILTNDAKFFYPWKGILRWSSEAFIPNFQAVLLGKMTPEDFCKLVTDDGNKILAEEKA